MINGMELWTDDRLLNVVRKENDKLVYQIFEYTGLLNLRKVIKNFLDIINNLKAAKVISNMLLATRFFFLSFI